MTLMKVGEKGLALIKESEGLRLKAYKCPAGVWSIGYGTTKGVTPGMEISESRAVALLKQDLRVAETYLNSLCINFSQNQFDALASWIYNLGVGSFSKSTLRKKIVAKADDEAITDEIVKWVNAGGKPLIGLKRRRVKEANLFLGKERYKVDVFGNIVKR